MHLHPWTRTLFLFTLVWMQPNCPDILPVPIYCPTQSETGCQGNFAGPISKSFVCEEVVFHAVWWYVNPFIIVSFHITFSFTSSICSCMSENLKEGCFGCLRACPVVMGEEYTGTYSCFWLRSNKCPVVSHQTKGFRYMLTENNWLVHFFPAFVQET